MLAQTLFDGRGNRKYLTRSERRAVAVAALRMAPPITTFCLTRLNTGARISELLAVTPERIDRANGIIVFETLKRRGRGFFRAVPVPPELLRHLEAVHGISAAQCDPLLRDKPVWKTAILTGAVHAFGSHSMGSPR
jgi:integrase